MESHYTFHFLDKAVFSCYNLKETQAKLHKWGLSPSMSLAKFRFDLPFSEFSPETFLTNLVNSPVISSVLPQFSTAKKKDPVTSISYKSLKCTETTMDLFQILKAHNLVYESGVIRKVMPEYVDDIEICDKIREVLLFEESEDFGIIDESVRAEFLFRIFEHLCIGGGMCQYEDEIDEYLEVVKGLYKDLVAVSKDEESGEIRVAGKVYQIEVNEELELFRNKHLQDFCYVVVDPGYRHVNVWMHKWTGLW